MVSPVRTEIEHDEFFALGNFFRRYEAILCQKLGPDYGGEGA